MYAVFLVYTLLIIAYILSSLFFAFGGRLPYSRWSSAVLGFLRDVCEPYLSIFRRFIPPIGPLDLSPMRRRSSLLQFVGGIVVTAHPPVDGDRRSVGAGRAASWWRCIALDQATKALVRSTSPSATATASSRASSSSTCATRASPSARFSGGGTVVAVIVGAALLALRGLLRHPPATSRSCGCRPGCCSAARSATSSTASATAP